MQLLNVVINFTTTFFNLLAFSVNNIVDCFLCNIIVAFQNMPML